MMIQRVFPIALAVAYLGVTAVRAEASAYSTVKSARHFAIGGVGDAGVTSKEEIAMRAIRDSPRA